MVGLLIAIPPFLLTQSLAAYGMVLAKNGVFFGATGLAHFLACQALIAFGEFIGVAKYG